MNPIKLVDPSGEILGAIVIPEEAERRLFNNGEVAFVIHETVRYHHPSSPVNSAATTKIIIKPAHSRGDAVMIVVGTVWDFEKCSGCFFIPGYAFSQREK